VSEQRRVHLPGREVLAALRHRCVKVTEHVSVNTVLRCFLIFGWDQMDTTQRLILMTSELVKARAVSIDAYDVGILIFIEHVQSGSQSATQDSWILW
jgi:hypothetical protein